MQRLQQLADRRAHDEQVIAAGLATALAQATKDFEETSQRLNEDHSQRRRSLENAYAEAKQTAATAYESGMAAAEAVRRDTQKAIENKRGSVAVGANHFVKEAEWQALSIYDAAKNKPFELIEEATLAHPDAAPAGRRVGAGRPHAAGDAQSHPGGGDL